MPQRILALDIGNREIRGVALESTFRDYRVTGLYEQEANGDASLGERLRALVTAHDLQPDTILVTLPSDLTAQRILALPFRDRKRLSQTIPFELESNTPFGLDEVIVDYHVLHRGRAGATVIAAMIQREDLELYLQTLAEIGLDPKVVDFAPLCSINLLRAITRDLPPTFAFVDVTPHDTTVALFRDGEIVGIRCVVPQPAPSSNGATPPSVESLIRDMRWTLMVLNGGELPADLPCILAGEPSEFLTEVARSATETAGLAVTRLESLELKSLPGVPVERAAAFARPLGLALREVEPSAASVGLNFRKEEFTYHRAQAELKSSLLRTGALVGVWLVMLLLNLFVDNWVQSNRVSKIDRQIRGVFEQTLSGVPIVGSAVDHMQSEISAMQNRLATLADTAPVGNLTAIDLVQAMTTAIPGNVQIEVDEFTMDPDAVRLRGTTQSFESVDELKNSFLALPYFREVQVRDPKTKGEGVEFRMILTLQKPGEETAS